MIQKFVPVARVNSKKKLPCMCKDTKKMMKRRARLFRIYRDTKRNVDFIKYKELRNKVNASIRKDRLNDQHKKCAACSNKTKRHSFIMSSQKAQLIRSPFWSRKKLSPFQYVLLLTSSGLVILVLQLRFHINPTWSLKSIVHTWRTGTWRILPIQVMSKKIQVMCQTLNQSAWGNQQRVLQRWR